MYIYVYECSRREDKAQAATRVLFCTMRSGRDTLYPPCQVKLVAQVGTRVFHLERDEMRKRRRAHSPPRLGNPLVFPSNTHLPSIAEYDGKVSPTIKESEEREKKKNAADVFFFSRCMIQGLREVRQLLRAIREQMRGNPQKLLREFSAVGASGFPSFPRSSRDAPREYRVAAFHLRHAMK